MELLLTSNFTLLIALAIIIILMVICFVMNLVNSSKINTLLDYSEDDDGDLITALKEYYDKVDDLSRTVNKNSDTAMLERLAECEHQAAI